jgi:lipid II:glycine glycyltransferase (peptidoglycan interpeptide bridge formation enzyme)
MTYFLQTSAWRAFQKNLGRKTFYQTGDGWSFLAILEHGRFNSRLYCPYGPVASSQKAFEDALKCFVALGKKHRVTFVRVEPTNPGFTSYLEQFGWRKVTYLQLQPEHSHLIDLRTPEDNLITQMSQPVRNIYRNYAKKGVAVHTSTNPNDIDILLKFVHEVAERTGIRPHDNSYFRQQAETLFPLGAAILYYATIDDLPIAAALFYDSDDMRTYAHAGASALPEHRKLNASTALLATAIVDAQRKGLQTVDLYGIAPDDAPKHHPWAGFTQFKRSFGGRDITYAGAWDLPLKKPAYWLYRLYQMIVTR